MESEHPSFTLSTLSPVCLHYKWRRDEDPGGSACQHILDASPQMKPLVYFGQMLVLNEYCVPKRQILK